MAYVVENNMRSEVIGEKVINFGVNYCWFPKFCSDRQTYVEGICNLVNKKVKHHSDRLNIHKLLKSGHFNYSCNYLSCV